MQQLLDAFGINWQLLIAKAVNFAIVLVALWYFLYKPVLAQLAKRQEIVAKSVSDAKQAEEMFAHADSEAESRVHAADTEAENIVAQARAAAHEGKEKLIADAESRAVTIEKDAEARATEVAARQRRESEQEVARLAILAAEKILKARHD